MSTYNFVHSGPNFTKFFLFNAQKIAFVNTVYILSLSSSVPEIRSRERRRNRGRRNKNPILNIFIRFGDIRRWTSKSSKIGPSFACFWPLKFFWGAPPEILDRHYKIGPSTDHRAKFHAGRPTHLGDLASEEKIKKTSAVKQKSFRKLSFSGGLKRQMPISQ